jgi:hypothetical protein
MVQFSHSRQQMMAEEGKKPRAQSRDLEHQEQAAFFNVLRMHEKDLPALKWVHAIPNGGNRDKRTAGRLWAEGVKAGVADIFVPIPVKGADDRWTFGMYIEFKAGKNKLTREQREFLGFAESQRYRFVVAYSWREALDALTEYLDFKFRIR